MNDNELISVIIPVFNANLSLKKCLDSVINQTYYNIEIIIVDDGSNDGSEIICDDYAGRDNRIMVFHQDNGGVSAARNFGLKKAKGQYIAFVDSDDFVDRDMFRELYELIKNNEADMSVCSFQYVDIIPGESDIRVSSIKDEILSGQDIILEKLFPSDGSQIYWGVIWNKLYSRKLMKGVEFPRGYALQDIYVMPQILSKCNKVACTSKKMYYYVQQSNSVLHSTKGFELDSPVVYLHIADYYSNRPEYYQVYKKSLEYGLHRYRVAFWKHRKDLQSQKKFKLRKKEAKQLFRSAWKRGRKLIMHLPKQFLYYELFYLNFHFACFLCAAIGK